MSLIRGGDQIEAAEEYPSKPIMAIVPFEPGWDIKRDSTEKVSAVPKLIVIVNKPGAGRRSVIEKFIEPSDGYTIGTGAASPSPRNAGLLSYDYRDFTLIGRSYHSNPILIASTKGKRPLKRLKQFCVR
jgi:tripartite-type tricarboxylate transporter receptor subunit TctC